MVKNKLLKLFKQSTKFTNFTFRISTGGKLKTSIARETELSKVRLKVSLHHYNYLNMDMKHDAFQHPITLFTNECTRDQIIIQHLFERSLDLKKELLARKSNEKVMHPQFLQKLIEQSVIRNTGKQLLYTDHMKKVSLYLFLLMGPLAYKVLCKNLQLPSLSTVKLKLGKESSVEEGKIQVDLIKTIMEMRQEPMFVWVAEDDTKITSRLKYNVENDCVMGLELPLDTNGLPKTSFFKFSSIKDVIAYVQNYRKSSYAKLVMSISLSEKSQAIPVVIYGTSGTDKAESVYSRWKNIKSFLANAGITAFGKKFRNSKYLISHNFFLTFRLL